MRRVLLALVLGAGAVALALSSSVGADPADQWDVSAATWSDACSPVVRHIDDPAKPGGHYDPGPQPVITINDAPGTNVNRRKTILHELGHAFADCRDINYTQYAAIRGLQSLDREDLMEDYAEVFMWVLADGAYPRTGSFPYAFDNVAGPPTDWQVEQMRKSSLLPD